MIRQHPAVQKVLKLQLIFKQVGAKADIKQLDEKTILDLFQSELSEDASIDIVNDVFGI